MIRYCKKCDLNKNLTEFTKKAKYCKNCIRKINNNYALKKGLKLRFIPIISGDSKQCTTCKIIKPLNEFSNSKRGRLGKSAYCKPCASEYQKKYLPKEIRKLKTRKYRNDNREWWRTLHRINQFNRRSKIKAQSDNTVTPDFVKLIYNKKKCYYCNEHTPKKYRTLDHKIPLNLGGLHSIHNIVMACLSCNSTKRDMTENEFKLYKLKYE